MSADNIGVITAILMVVVFLIMVRAIYGLFAWKGERKKAVKQLFGAPAGGLAILAVLIIVFQPNFESQTAIAQGENEVRVTETEPSELPAQNLTRPQTNAARSAQNLTRPQTNAVRSAQNYLRLQGFSRAGLIAQLSSDFGDRYSVVDATAAVDSLSVDWNEQAVRSARSYLAMMGFSCNGLIEQLSSDFGDRYTRQQATYGANQAGAC